MQKHNGVVVIQHVKTTRLFTVRIKASLSKLLYTKIKLRQPHMRKRSLFQCSRHPNDIERNDAYSKVMFA